MAPSLFLHGFEEHVVPVQWQFSYGGSCGSRALATTADVMQPRVRVAHPVSFKEFECGPGYMCVSRVPTEEGAADGFPYGHNGLYEKGKNEGVPELPEEVKAGIGKEGKFPPLYEIGCPARGAYDPALGECRAPDSRPLPDQPEQEGADVKFCYTPNRYDASVCTGVDDCLCIKRDSRELADGMKDVGAIVDDGKEVLIRKFAVKRDPSAGETAQGGDQNPKDGNEETQKEEGEAGQAKQEEAKKDLMVIPHYSLWTPHDSLMQPGSEQAPLACPNLPTVYVPGKESSLPRSQYLEAYKKAAPYLQHLLDCKAQTLQAKDTCSGADKGFCCRTVTQFQQLKSACQQMQATLQRIGTSSPDVDEASSSRFLKLRPGLQCQASKKDGAKCLSLYCYGDGAAEAGVNKIASDKGGECKEMKTEDILPAALKQEKTSAADAEGVTGAAAVAENGEAPAAGGAQGAPSPEVGEPKPQQMGTATLLLPSTSTTLALRAAVYQSFL